MKDKIMTAITKMLDNPNISTPYTIYNDEECCEEIMEIVNQYRVAEIKKLKDDCKNLIEINNNMAEDIKSIPDIKNRKEN